MSCKVLDKDRNLVRHFPSLVEVCIFVDADVYDVEIAMQEGKSINGYFVETDH